MSINKFEEIAEFFKAKREASGLSQKVLSEKLGYGNNQIVSNWERGKCSPPLHQIAALVKILNLNKNEVTELFLNITRIEIKENLKLGSGSRAKRLKDKDSA